MPGGITLNGVICAKVIFTIVKVLAVERLKYHRAGARVDKEHYQEGDGDVLVLNDRDGIFRSTMLVHDVGVRPAQNQHNHDGSKRQDQELVMKIHGDEATRRDHP